MEAQQPGFAMRMKGVLLCHLQNRGVVFWFFFSKKTILACLNIQQLKIKDYCQPGKFLLKYRMFPLTSLVNALSHQHILEAVRYVGRLLTRAVSVCRRLLLSRSDPEG